MKSEFAALTQAVEYLLGKEEVDGSSPLGSSKKPLAILMIARGFVLI